ncbi:MAG: tagaturonate reductase [Cyclobacteriaceae bacterium]|nr:tagaturonate reductase [Cyclobacteriaceae bacterium]UYN85480.1 MAG: tagaturonate reductase [Cyclobacteriaceae bacterium]
MMNITSQLPAITSLGKKIYTVRVLQFGTGNFLRAFADWMIQKANDHLNLDLGVAMVQSMSSHDNLLKQDGMYTVLTRGLEGGKIISQADKIDVVQRLVNGQDLTALLAEAENPDLEIILSNTTETGITFNSADTSHLEVAKTFPGKLTQLLLRRFELFPTKELGIIPCELIEKNGSILKQCILKYAAHWNLPAEFEEYITTRLYFSHTLVDRIVPGLPENPQKYWEEIGHEDNALVMCEPYHLWAIEASPWVRQKFPLDRAGLNVIYTEDLEPYRVRKVRILNGMHSVMAPVGYLAGLETVQQAMEHEIISVFLKKILDEEILPFIPGDQEFNRHYSKEVIERFLNPSIKHKLIDITLYSFSKFRVRLLPSIKHYEKINQHAPSGLAFAIAALLFIYRGLKAGKQIPLKDDPQTIKFLQDSWADTNYTENGIRLLVSKLLQEKKLWGQDLNAVHGLTEQVAKYLYRIDQYGIVAALKELQAEY